MAIILLQFGNLWGELLCVFTAFHYSVGQQPGSGTLAVLLMTMGTWTEMASIENHDQERGGDYFVLSQNKHHSDVPVQQLVFVH